MRGQEELADAREKQRKKEQEQLAVQSELLEVMNTMKASIMGAGGEAALTVATRASEAVYRNNNVRLPLMEVAGIGAFPNCSSVPLSDSRAGCYFSIQGKGLSRIGFLSVEKKLEAGRARATGLANEDLNYLWVYTSVRAVPRVPGRGTLVAFSALLLLIAPTTQAPRSARCLFCIEHETY